MKRERDEERVDEERGMWMMRREWTRREGDEERGMRREGDRHHMFLTYCNCTAISLWH